jgi:hypothetical protein
VCRDLISIRHYAQLSSHQLPNLSPIPGQSDLFVVRCDVPEDWSQTDDFLCCRLPQQRKSSPGAIGTSLLGFHFRRILWQASSLDGITGISSDEFVQNQMRVFSPFRTATLKPAFLCFLPQNPGNHRAYDKQRMYLRTHTDGHFKDVIGRKPVCNPSIISSGVLYGISW